LGPDSTMEFGIWPNVSNNWNTFPSIA